MSVHGRVSPALACALLDREDPEFQELFRQTTELLKRVFRTQQDTVIMQAEAVVRAGGRGGTSGRCRATVTG